jgi:Domain of unknown function (DUF4282)
MSYDPGAPGDRSQPGGYGGPPGGQPPYGSGYGQQPPPGPPGPPAGWGPPGGGYPSGPGGGQPMQAEGKNFFAALFDYSFNSFATPGLIRVLYIIGTVVIALGWLGYSVVAFQFSAVLGLITLVFGAIVALFMLAFLRVSLEFYYAVVRMSEDIHNRR